MYRIWSINTRNNKILWLMSEEQSLSEAMRKAERVVLDSNPKVETVNFERSSVYSKPDKTTNTSIMCYSHDEVVGSVITGPDLDIDSVAGLLGP